MSTKPLTQSPDVGIVSKQKAIDYLYDDVIRDNYNVCDNCFGRRDYDRHTHRTWGGGNDFLTDKFCTCGSGTGQPHAADVSQPQLRGGEGTISRQWSDGSLPIRDSTGLSEMGILRRIAYVLEDWSEYEVKSNLAPVFDAVAKRSTKYPRKNVQTLKWGAWLVLTPEAREKVRRDVAQD